MATPARTTQLSGIYETLGQLIKNPKSLGLREDLPPRVLAVLASTREILRDEMMGRTSIAGGENDLTAEPSQDSDTQQSGVTQESLATAGEPKLHRLAATV